MADPMTIMAVASAVGAGASVQQGAQARSQAKKGERKDNEAIAAEKQAQLQEEQRGKTQAALASQRQRRIAGGGGRQGSFLTGLSGNTQQQGQQRTLLGG